MLAAVSLFSITKLVNSVSNSVSNWNTNVKVFARRLLLKTDQSGQGMQACTTYSDNMWFCKLKQASVQFRPRPYRVVKVTPIFFSFFLYFSLNNG